MLRPVISSFQQSATLDAGAKSTGAVTSNPLPDNSTLNGTTVGPGGTSVGPGGTPPLDLTPQPGAAASVSSLAELSLEVL